MWLRVDVHANRPIYQQIIDGIKEQIVRGILQPGQRLLTVRELATTLSLNHNTVAKAYQILERERVITLVRGRGTYVAATPDAGDLQDIERRTDELREALRMWMVQAHHLQWSDAQMMSLFKQLAGELRVAATATEAEAAMSSGVEPQWVKGSDEQ